MSDIEKTILYLMSEAILEETHSKEYVREKVDWGVELLKKINCLTDKEKRFK